MKTLFSVLFLSLVVISQSCSFTALNQTKTEYINYLKSLEGTNEYTTAKTLEVLTKFQAIIKELQICANEAGSLFTAGTKKNLVVSSQNCFAEEETPEWSSDPCCNRDLQDVQCCIERPRNVSYVEITAFNEAQLNSKCTTPSKFKNLANFLGREYPLRFASCNSNFLTSLRKEFEIFEDLIRCLVDTITSPPVCDKHDDCLSGVCNLFTGVCLTSGADGTNALAKCFLTKLSIRGGRYLRRLFKLQASSPDAELYTAFKNYVTKNSCVNANGNGIDLTATTQAQCEATKACTYGGTTQCNTQKTAFCGRDCNPRNGICTNDVTSITTRTDCERYGACLGKGWFNGLQPWTRETCENGVNKKCSALECNFDGNCDATKCASYSLCVGFPSNRKDVCIVSFTKGDNGENKCPILTQPSPIGCISGAQTQIGCSIAKGTWVAYPKTESECLSYKRCYDEERKRFSHREGAACTNCGGKIVSLYTWRPAALVDSNFINYFTWTNVSVVNVRKWTQAVDEDNLGKFVIVYLISKTFDLYSTYFSCVLGPLVHTLGVYACDCGSPKAPAGTKCYDAASFGVYRSVVFSQLNQTLNFTDGSVQLTNKAVTSDSIEITVEQTPATVVEVNTAASTSTKSDFTILNILQNSNTPYLVGNGLAVKSSSALQEPVNLCISKNVLAAKPPAANKFPGFALETSGTYFAAGIKISSDTESQMCGWVTDQKTYYPAYFTTPQSSSVKASLSFVFLVVCILAYIF